MNYSQETNNNSQDKDASFVASILGLVFICFSLYNIISSENNTVKEYVTRKFINNNYVKTATDYIEPENDGKLVLFSGKTDVQEILIDTMLNVSASNSMSLIRDVEMFQWTEHSEVHTRNTSKGKTEIMYTTYDYTKKWSSTYHDTNSFNNKGYKNPIHKYINYRSRKILADNIKIGAHIIPSKDIGFGYSFDLF